MVREPPAGGAAAMTSMLAFRLACIVGPALGLFGCATLDVEVDILNPGYVHQETDDFRIERWFLRIQGGDPQDTEDQLSALRTKHKSAIEELARVYDADAAAVTDETQKSLFKDSANDLRASVSPGGVTSQQFETFRSDLLKLDSTIRTVGTAADARRENGKLNEALQNLVRQRVHLDQAFRANRRAEIVDATLQTANPEEAQQRYQVSSVAVALRSPIGGGSLTASDFAYFVASAPPESWVPRFNRAYGTGQLGNSDIAIKLGEDGEFTVKGLTFDPSTVAAVASKVTTQALLLAAQLNGVPVGKSSLAAGTPTPGFLGTGDDLSAQQTLMLQRTESINAQLRVVENLALAILNEEAAIKDDDKRAGARVAIRASFDAQRTMLALDGYQ